MRATLAIAVAAVLAGLIAADAYSIRLQRAILSDLQDLRHHQAARSTDDLGRFKQTTDDLGWLKRTIPSNLQDVRHQAARLTDDLGWLTANAKIKIVPDLNYIPLGGKNVKAVKGKLHPDVDVVTALSLKNALDWTPKGPNDIPMDWPKRYIEEYHQPFNPYTFAINAGIMADRIKWHALKADAPNIDVLLAALKRYSDTLPGGALAVRYDFDNPMYDGKIAAGWHSAFGNGAVIVGLLELAEATGNKDFRELAGKYVDALRWHGTDSDIVMLDGSDFLWFEETPRLNGKPTHVMNGHIAAVFSLYRYWQVTGDESVLTLVRAGLATAARYLPELRRPGQVPAYALYDRSVPDYGPLRMIVLAKTMSAISDNPAFRRIVEMLLTDSSVNR